MAIQIEKWLAQHNVNYTAKRNKSEIQIACNFERWKHLSDEYNRLAEENTFTLKQCMLISFIICELKNIPLTKEMLAENYDSNKLQAVQQYALKLFIADDEEETLDQSERIDNHSMTNHTDNEGEDNVDDDEVDTINMIQFINQEIKATTTQSNYYYLLKKIKHRIQDLDQMPQNIYHRNDDDNLTSVSHSSKSSATKNSSATPATATPTFPKKLIIEVKTIIIEYKKITVGDHPYDFWSMLKNTAQYVTTGLWDWFAWSNHNIINNFSNKEAKVANDKKQAVKTAFHEYKQLVDEITILIQIFNNTSIEGKDTLKSNLTLILQKQMLIETKKNGLLMAIKNSRDDIWIDYFNSDLLAFYQDIEDRINENHVIISDKKVNIENEVSRIQAYYEKLTENLDTLDEKAIELRADYLVALVDNEIIYIDLLEKIDTYQNAGKLNFLNIIEKATDKILAVTNTLNYKINESKLETLNAIAEKIKHTHAHAYGAKIFAKRAPLLNNFAIVENFEDEIKPQLEAIKSGGYIDSIALAIQMLVVPKYSHEHKDLSFDILQNLYSNNDWWPSFATVYQVLLDLLEGKNSIQNSELIAFVPAYNIKLDHLTELQNALEVLKSDYPKTAPGLSEKLTPIVDALRRSVPRLNKFDGAQWSVKPAPDPTKTDNSTTSDYTSSFVNAV